MANGDKSSRQLMTDYLTLIASFLVSIVSIVGAVIKVGGIRVLLIIIAVLGLVFFVYFLCRKIKRARQRRRLLHLAQEPGKTGFNEALSYTTADAGRFYGRLDDTAQVLRQIGQAGYRLGVVHGESGVGKTSLIQAGLIPQLRKDNIKCVCLSMNRLAADMSTAAGILAFITRETGSAFDLKDCRDLEDIGSRLAGHSAPYAVVFLDQFEQVFDRVDEAARQELAQHLEAFFRAQQRLKLAVIVREDYFGRVHYMFRELERNAIYYLYKFNRTQAREVIRKSAGSSENLPGGEPGGALLDFEDAVLEDLVDKDGRVHPVELSLICSTLIKVNGKLDRRDYLAGGKKQGWLSRYLEDVLKGQPQKEALQVLSSLIHQDKAATLTARQVAGRSGVNLAETGRLLEDFRQSRLVVTDTADADQAAIQYRLAHEYLIAPIRLRCGDVETPVQKYSRLLDTRAAAWDRDNRSGFYLLKGKSLLAIRFRYRQHLAWDREPLKKALVHKSFARFTGRWAISALLIAGMAAGLFLTIHNLIEKGKRNEYLSVLKYKDKYGLQYIETDLLRLSGESLDLKLKILSGVLAVENQSLYYDDIMPVLYHTLIGISVENRDKIMAGALAQANPGNVVKLSRLFTKKYADSAYRSRFQQKLPGLIKTTKDTARKIYICNKLGEIGDEQTVPILIQLLNDSEQIVRGRAAEALGQIGEKSEAAVPALLPLLKLKDLTVRGRAAYALGQIGNKNEKVISALISLLKDADIGVRSSAAEALGNIGSQSEPAVSALIKLLKDKDDGVRGRAAFALGQIGKKSEAAVPDLIRLLREPDENVCCSAIDALGQIGEKAQAAVPDLIKRLKDPDGNVRSSAAYVLGEIGKPAARAIPALKVYYQQETDDRAKCYYLEALLRLDPDHKKEYLARLIEEVLPLPLIDRNNIKSSILETAGWVAAQEGAKPEVVGQNRDFDGNMWAMLAWWDHYKKKHK